jgi:hypothetical protein
MRESYDTREGYCRQLGHHVRFQYCREAAGSLPCPRIADCWFETIPAEQFLRDNYSDDERARIFAPRPSKIESILSVVQRLTDPPSGS